MIATMMRRMGLLAVLAGGALALCAGCANSGYANWPPVGGNTASNDVNAPPVYIVITEALKWTSEKYPPVANPELGERYSEPFAVNLPTGMRADMYRQVVSAIGPSCRALSEETQTLPTYHIARVYVRGPYATVDVVYPVVSMSVPSTGTPVYRGVTLTLHAGQQPWRVIHHKVYPVGVLDVPAPNYLPVEIDPNRNADSLTPPPGVIKKVSEGGGEG